MCYELKKLNIKLDIYVKIQIIITLLSYFYGMGMRLFAFQEYNLYEVEHVFSYENQNHCKIYSKIFSEKGSFSPCKSQIS